MTQYHSAQINVGRFLYLCEDAANPDFINAIDPVNALADTLPGFINVAPDGMSAVPLLDECA